MLTLAPDCKLFLHPIAKNHNIGKCVKVFALLKQRGSHDSRKNDEQINAAKPVLAFTSEMKGATQAGGRAMRLQQFCRAKNAWQPVSGVPADYPFS